MQVAWCEIWSGTSSHSGRKGVLMMHLPMHWVAIKVLLMMVVLLHMMLLVVLMLIFVLLNIHLHVSLMTIPSIYHRVLPLLVSLIVHCERIVSGRLRDW